jgi:hypothetical protein
MGSVLQGSSHRNRKLVNVVVMLFMKMGHDDGMLIRLSRGRVSGESDVISRIWLTGSLTSPGIAEGTISAAVGRGQEERAREGDEVISRNAPDSIFSVLVSCAPLDRLIRQRKPRAPCDDRRERVLGRIWDESWKRQDWARGFARVHQKLAQLAQFLQ